MGPFDQDGFRVRLEWGAAGLARLAPAAVVVVVDVLRFTTAVSVAVDRGAVVFPYPWRDGGESEYAERHGAVRAGMREDGGWSLSPTDLARIPAGTRLVLPSPNGSAVAFAARDCGAVVIAGCLRNAPAVGRFAAAVGGAVSVIAAGEHTSSGDTRFSVEDHLGAGAVVAALDLPDAVCSPEARAASSVFAQASGDLAGWLQECGSGRELVARGWADDVAAAAEYGVSAVAPVLRDDAFTT